MTGMITNKTETKNTENNVVPITSLKINQKAKVAFIRGNQKIIQRLSDLGLTPMSKVVLVRKALLNGPLEVLVRRTTLAIDSDIAHNIFVETIKEDE